MTDPAPTGPPLPGARPRRASWALALALLVYVLDQVTKVLAVAHLEPGVREPFVGELLQFHLIRNPGAAFSFATGSTWIFTVVAVAVVVAVLWLVRRLRSTGWAFAFGFLLAGAAGNLTDRLVRQPGFARGHVVDFLELPRWPIFNVADASICAAAVLIAVLSLRGVDLDGTREQRSPRGAGEGSRA
ncbi:signal peptidase II [Paenibacillus sp. TRM 82003]|uniref:signal peptidase II n=1 Tax=Kineococcus sp. TRM81007 TaxID=2925831 RepID=UPI001F5ACA66|nr:signal peptidase II [Kineococcus sp. TRM81007]MCI2239714.1 signal peptidase II [Kineococcus sp. TRM81007]MCI3926723.1 signal peptidase II [Paenibacillus sp. TRM 82003]